VGRVQLEKKGVVRRLLRRKRGEEGGKGVERLDTRRSVEESRGGLGW